MNTHDIINLIYHGHILLISLVSKIFLDFTELFVISTTMVFSSTLNILAYRWPTNISFKSWLWDPQINFTIHPSSPFTGLPSNLKGQSHFLVPLLLTSMSFLYYLYLSPFSQYNNMYVILPCCSIHISDLNITITKSKPQATLLAYSKNSSWLPNTYNNICQIYISFIKYTSHIRHMTK